MTVVSIDQLRRNRTANAWAQSALAIYRPIAASIEACDWHTATALLGDIGVDRITAEAGFGAAARHSSNSTNDVNNQPHEGFG